MNEQPDNIERELRSMTEWEGESPQLWERAVEQTDREGAEPVARIRPWHARRWVVAVGSIAAVLLISVGLFGPHSGRSPSRADVTAQLKLDHDSNSPRDQGPYVTPSLLASPPETSVADETSGSSEYFRAFSTQLRSERASSRVPAMRGEPSSDRAVVRKATMEITTPDVRAAALKAQQLLSQPKGEFVESADIDDSNKDRPRADLVLRVEATRLEEVLTQLRELGEVKTERIDGEDVTDQMVDLGARLDSERRIEQELIELLEARENDELNDILSVRRELNKVREQIERLAAQQDNLSRMVRLARVAIMLRTEIVEPEPEPKQGVWGRFVDDLGAAWTDGLFTLLGTIANFVRLLVGGAIWFAIAAFAAALAWRSWRHHHPRALAE
jgi:hypothetical protein